MIMRKCEVNAIENEALTLEDEHYFLLAPSPPGIFTGWASVLKTNSLVLSALTW